MVDYRVVNTTAILTVNNPPVNAISAHVKTGLLKNVVRANQDPAVKSVVVCGEGNFIAGADIREFQSRRSPGGGDGELISLQTMCCELEKSEKPVVAAIRGFALGGGLEVALACHYRVAHQQTSFGFPEVTLGILPAACGTQRFPRLVGLKAALELITSGRRFGITEASKLKLVDQVVTGDVVEAAIKFAESIASKPVAPRRISSMTVPDASQATQLREEAQKTAAQKYPGLLAPVFCIKSVLASVEGPFEHGLAVERDLAALLNTSGQAKALQYAFFAERQAGKWQLADGSSGASIKPQPVKSTAVIGAGTMGSGIAVAILSAGFPVILIEDNKQLLDRGLETVRQLLEGSVAVKKLSAEACKQALTRLRGSVDLGDIRDVDLVIEAVFENMALKKQIFAKLDKTCKRDAILCSNTSSLDIDEIASSTQRADRVMGTHFFVPAYHMKLLENIRGAKTSPETIATVMAFSKQIGKMPVLVKNCWAFAANRINKPLRYENEFLAEEGVSPYEVDKVLEQFGFPMGPFKVSDLSGMDVSYKIQQELLASKGLILDVNKRFVDGERFCPLIAAMIARQRVGRKTGKGWYKYDKPGAKIPYEDAETLEILAAYRTQRNVEPRRISTQEIESRCLLAAINEAFKVLEEGVAHSAEAIDTIMIQAFGWPRHTGGPLFYARQIGLATVYNNICELHKRFPTSRHWQPSDLLRRLACNNVPAEKWSKEAMTFHSHL